MDEEGISSLDCVRYLAWTKERGTIGASALQPYLSAINTLMRHSNRDDAQDTGPAIIDMKHARFNSAST